MKKVKKQTVTIIFAALLCAILLSCAGEKHDLSSEGSVNGPKDLPEANMGREEVNLLAAHSVDWTEKESEAAEPQQDGSSQATELTKNTEEGGNVEDVEDSLSANTTLQIGEAVAYNYEEPYPEIDPWILHEEDEQTAGEPEAPLPKVAIIIDDMGYHRGYGEQLLALDYDITFSYLPHAPYTEEQEEEAWILGRDIMLHQPLEALNSKYDPDPGALFVHDDEQSIMNMVLENLEFVPHAVGVNNHMGSRFTENSEAMRSLLASIRDEGLFFVDSVTSPRSVAYTEAQRMEIKTARRHIFLDHVRDENKICHQLGQLVKVAKQKGWAIGIGHPNKYTIAALTKCAETLLADVEVVGIHELAK